MLVSKIEIRKLLCDKYKYFRIQIAGPHLSESIPGQGMPRLGPVSEHRAQAHTQDGEPRPRLPETSHLHKAPMSSNSNNQSWVRVVSSAPSQ